VSGTSAKSISVEATTALVKSLIAQAVYYDGDPLTLRSELKLKDPPLSYDDGVWFLQLRYLVERTFHFQLLSDEELRRAHDWSFRDSFTVGMIIDRVHSKLLESDAHLAV